LVGLVHIGGNSKAPYLGGGEEGKGGSLRAIEGIWEVLRTKVPVGGHRDGVRAASLGQVEANPLGMRGG